MRRIKLSLKIVLISFFALIVTNCNKDDGNPPVLPPAESMTIDFSNFTAQNKSAGIASATAEINNWGFSALVAGYFKSLVVVTLAVPVYSFKMAANEVPVSISDKTWQWNYSTTLQNTTYLSRLTGQIRETDVLWEMHISGQGAGSFPEFLWFTGTSKLDGSSGQWLLNHSAQYQEPLLQIDWAKTGTAMGTIKYTYVRTLNDSRAADPFKTSYFEYGKTSGSYDSYYTVHYYSNPSFSDANVEWNSTTREGRVKCTGYFGDANWHCWNTSLVNITCP